VWSEQDSAQLQDGKYERKATGDFESVRLNAAHCIKSATGRFEILQFSWTYGGGSGNDECIVQVLSLQSARPVVTQQIQFDCHALTAGSTFNRHSRGLTVRARTSDDSPNCCARTLDVVKFEWRGDKFELDRFDRVPAVVKKGPNGTTIH
jgi:hypothetical protein